jgi:hypothetical protein
VDVRRDVGDAIAFRHAGPLQPRRPPVAAIAEGIVGEAQRTIDDGGAAAVETPRPPKNSRGVSGTSIPNPAWRVSEPDEDSILR